MTRSLSGKPAWSAATAIFMRSFRIAQAASVGRVSGLSFRSAGLILPPADDALADSDDVCAAIEVNRTDVIGGDMAGDDACLEPALAPVEEHDEPPGAALFTSDHVGAAIPVNIGDIQGAGFVEHQGVANSMLDPQLLGVGRSFKHGETPMGHLALDGDEFAGCDQTEPQHRRVRLFIPQLNREQAPRQLETLRGTNPVIAA